MRTNKGYQRDFVWYEHKRANSRAKGHNISLDCFIGQREDMLRKRIENIRKQYAIAEDKNITDTASYESSTFYLKLWELRFDWENDKKLIPVEKAIDKAKKDFHFRNPVYDFQKRTVHKDNQRFVYNSSHGGNCNDVRIPSLKRSRAVWKRFYELFPRYELMSHDAEYRMKYKLKEL
jgi:hypothetical protein